MGIIGEGRLLSKSRVRFMGGATVAPERQNFNLSQRNIFIGEASFDKKSAIPNGYKHPGAWLLPQKPGGMASRNEANLALNCDDSVAVMGLPTSGSISITFSQSGVAGLIANGSGTATITFSQAGILSSVATASGTASITFSQSALLGALAGLYGTANITLTPTATIKAVGYMSGLSTNETEFSANALAAAVWQALAASFNDPGTMGEKLNSASSAGDPWGTLLPGAYGDGTAGKILGSKVLTSGKFLALK